MFDIKEIDILGQTNKLLFNIWQELKVAEKPQKPREVKPAVKPAKRKPAKKKPIKKDGGSNG